MNIGVYSAHLLRVALLIVHFVIVNGKGGFTGWLRHEWRLKADVQESLEAIKSIQTKFLRCPSGLHELVRRYFRPHQAITQEMISDAISPNRQQAILRSIVLVQVIESQIFVDYSMSGSLKQWEQLRLEFLLERLYNFLAKRSVHCSKASRKCLYDRDFEFVIDLKDCQSYWTSNTDDGPQYKEESGDQALKHYSRLPIMTITKCKGRNTIPLAQWHVERDGPFDKWDAYRLEFIARIQQSPYWTRQRYHKWDYFKALVRQSFEEHLDDETNWQELGRSKLLFLAWNRPDLLDVGLSMDPGSRKIFDGYVNYLPRKVYMAGVEQAITFQYVVYAEGWCGWADRLKILLMYNSTIFLQRTPCHEYYQDLMVPYKHYIPVDGRFRNLPKRVEWAKRHPRAAQQIAVNAMRLGQTYLNEAAISCYMDIVFAKYSTLVEYKPKKRPLAQRWCPMDSCPSLTKN